MNEPSYPLDEAGEATLKKWGGIDQIAAEAWSNLDRELLTHHNLDGGKSQRGIAIIKSACEKAMAPCYKQTTHENTSSQQYPQPSSAPGLVTNQPVRVDSMAESLAQKGFDINAPKSKTPNDPPTQAAAADATDDFDVIEKAIGDPADSAAHDLDHYQKNHAKWYRAVKKARKALAGLKSSYNCLIMINEQRRRNCVHSSKAVEQPEKEDSGSTPDAHVSDATQGQEWTMEYVTERLGLDASWPQIIEAANYSINAAIRVHCKQVWDQRTLELTHDKEVAIAAERRVSQLLNREVIELTAQLAAATQGREWTELRDILHLPSTDDDRTQVIAEIKRLMRQEGKG